jgi:hypothetical protein
VIKNGTWMVSQDAVGNNRQVFAACPCSVTRVGYGVKTEMSDRRPDVCSARAADS